MAVQDLIPCEKLKGCPLFSRLSMEDLEPLMGDAVLERHAAGAVFFRQGERAERFFVILKGRVVLYVGEGDASPSIAGIVGPGQTFAEAAICGQGVYPMTAEALEATEVVAIPGEPFCRLLEQRFDLVLSMLGEMSLRLRGLLRQIMDLKMKTTAQRLAAHLVGLTEAETGKAEIRLRYAALRGISGDYDVELDVERACELDPDYADAWQMRMYVDAAANRSEAAAAATGARTT